MCSDLYPRKLALAGSMWMCQEHRLGVDVAERALGDGRGGGGRALGVTLGGGWCHSLREWAGSAVWDRCWGDV